MADAKQGGQTAEVTKTEIVKKEADVAVPGKGVAHRAETVVKQVHARVKTIPAMRRNWLMGGMLFLAAGCAGLMWFWGRPDYRVLFSGLDAKDVQSVSGELSAAGIPFEPTGDGGGIQVPADMLDKARMEVASKGMPQTGRLGFELFDKPNWVGSEFDERVNYQRALEGELEHTIGSLGEVKTARVHLVLPQASLFTAQEKVAKASVVLKLRRANLSPEQADSIRSLVAGAVENLVPDNVALVDAEGRVNLAAKGHGSAAAADEEAALEAKLVAMLEPLAGRENVRATVNVSYDEGSEVHTDEVYDPEQEATLTMRKSEQVSGSKTPVSGVPGTASNTPAAATAGSVAAAGAAVAAGTPPLLKEPLPVFPGGAAGGQTIKEENGTYGVTRHLSRFEQGPGRIKRVTAAVVVNDRQVPEGVGKAEHMVWKPRDATEMKRLETLAQAAVGFDEKRGDTVVMSNVSFSSNAPEVKLSPTLAAVEEAKSFLHTEPAVVRTATMGLIGLVVVMFVLRPVAKQMTATLKQPVLLASGTPTGSAGGAAQQAAALGDGSGSGSGSGAGAAAALGAADAGGIPKMPTFEPEAVTRARKRQAKQGQMMFEHVAEQITREPVQSTRLLESWIGGAEGD